MTAAADRLAPDRPWRGRSARSATSRGPCPPSLGIPRDGAPGLPRDPARRRARPPARHRRGDARPRHQPALLGRAAGEGCWACCCSPERSPSIWRAISGGTGARCARWRRHARGRCRYEVAGTVIRRDRALRRQSPRGGAGRSVRRGSPMRGRGLRVRRSARDGPSCSRSLRAGGTARRAHLQRPPRLRSPTSCWRATPSPSGDGARRGARRRRGAVRAGWC